MPKIRGIKPEFWTDEDIVELSLPARLLFIGLWNLACDNGHVPDKPKQIKMRLLPADAVNVDSLLNELVENGRIRRAGGTVTILKFAHHQKPHRRWWSTCDLPLCNVPEDAPEQGFNRGKGSNNNPSQPGRNRGATVGHGGTTADVDGEGDGDSDVEGERPSPRKRATQIPADWKPNDQHRAFATDNLLSVDEEAAQFADHHRARGSVMKDWDAAFRTWLRNAVKFRKDSPAAARRLPHASQLEEPPPGLSDQEYAAWYAEQQRRRA